MELTVDQALQEGIAAHKEGKLQDAERFYRAILEAQPSHPDANHNLGVLAVAIGKPLEAIPLFKLALQANFKSEQFWLSYIDALIRLERFDEAEIALVEGEKSGVSLQKLNIVNQLLQESVRNDARTMVKGQTLTDKRKNLAERNKGKKRKVQGSSSSATPSQVQINHLLEHYQAGRLKEAEALATSLTQQFPKHPFGWKVLGAVFQQTGRLEESIIPMQSALKLSLQDAEAHYNLAVTLKLLGRLNQAEASYRQAIALKPDLPEAYSSLGNTLVALGKLDEAEASYSQAIALEPDFAEAHRNLSTIKNFSSEDEQLFQMKALYLDPAISEENRCHVCFALAKASEDLEDFATAFQFYAEGNALLKKQLAYDKERDAWLFEAHKTSHRQIAAHFLQPANLAPECAPIFIVGMARSGTTLVEQIISSHSLVTGAGELSFVSQFGNPLVVGQAPVDVEALTAFRGQYLNALKKRSDGNAIVTDKMPQNFRFLGLIASVFPDAKIIHVKRNPAAVCWANYTQYFVRDSLAYCCDLDDILHYHELYQDLMGYWHDAFPNRIYDLDYEVLTERQEEETRKLIGHLELPWDDVCLSPQDNKRGVVTASNVQVRKKVYQGSLERWKRYKPYLNGVLDRFGIGS